MSAERSTRTDLRELRAWLRMRSVSALPLRRSLRFTALLAIALVLLVPQALVLGWVFVEQAYAARMQGNAAFAADEAAAALAAGPAPDAAAGARLDDIAAAHQVRVRVVDAATGAVLAAHDHDAGTDLSQRLGDWLLGASVSMSLDELDGTLGPILARPEVAQAGARPDDCRASADASLVVCHGVRRVPPAPRPAPSATAPVRFEAPERDAGPVWVYVQDSSRRPMAHLSYLRLQVPRLMLATLPFALLLAWWMGRRVVAPLEALRGQALAKVGEPNPRADLALRGGDEMQDLTQAFNALLAALEERRGANEAFVADLVHELKNPVATVRACAESLAASPLDAERVARLSRLLAESSGRLDALVSQFLELARAEAGMREEPRSRVDLGALARGVVRTLAESPRWSGVEMAVTGAERAEVVGVEYRLDSVVRNLVENAASFSGEGGRVRVELGTTGSTVTLCVSDTGPGIADEDRDRIFGRFFTRRSGEQGTGLGLALVRAVVEAHGGTVSATSTPGQGATLSVVLPAAPG